MYKLFDEATSFNQDIRNWDVSNVTSLSRTFSGATSFNQDISNWNTSNVTTLNSTFYKATSFNQNLGKWVFKQQDLVFTDSIGVEEMYNAEYMFAYSGLS